MEGESPTLGPYVESYIVVFVRNVEVRWNEHSNPAQKSNPSKHINDNANHVFQLVSVDNAPKNVFQQKVLQMLHCLEQAALNEQLEPDKLNLLRNGVTCCIIM